MSNLFLLLTIFTCFLLNYSNSFNCWISDEEDGEPIKREDNCQKSHCFVVSCGGMIAHGCGDGMEACDQMKATCFDATIQSNKVGQFEGLLRDNRCALCQQGDLCNVPEKLPAAENPHKCWDTGATEQIEGGKTILSKIDCGLEAIGCYRINGPDGKVSKGCFENEPAFSLLRKLLNATIEQTKLCIGDYCNA